jgi:hypothetical protein
MKITPAFMFISIKPTRMMRRCGGGKETEIIWDSVKSSKSVEKECTYFV